QSLHTLQQLVQQYRGAYVVRDAAIDVPGLLVYDWPQALPPVPAPPLRPAIPSERVVASLFTSGSTGRPQPHAKTWCRLVANGRAEAEALGFAGRAHVLVGTVPVQHSYGFESTFLLALHGG